jgi:hypothetical protein
MEKREITEIFKDHILYRKHDTDSVMNSLWSFYKRHFIALFLTSLLLSAIMQYLMSAFDLVDIQNYTDPEEIINKVRELMLPVIIISLISIWFTILLTYYVIHHPIDNQTTIFVSAVKAFKYYIPYLIIMVLLAFFGSVLMALGLLVFLIGFIFAAIYIATIYMFILPVMIVEGTDIGHAIARTFRIVHRKFWINIGWVAIFVALLTVISVMLSALILLPFTGSLFNTVTDPSSVEGVSAFMDQPGYLILSTIINALYLPALPVFSTILYFNAIAAEEELSE